MTPRGSRATKLAATASLLLVAACLHGARPAEADAWLRIRDAHTRSVKLYAGLAQVAFASATWESPEVRAARVERTAGLKAMTPIERRIVHIALRDDTEVTTESRGEGFYKRVAILLRSEAEVPSTDDSTEAQLPQEP